MILVRVHLSDDGQEHGLDRAFVNVIAVDFVKLRQEPFDILGKGFFVHISFILCSLTKSHPVNFAYLLRIFDSMDFLLMHSLYR